MAGATQRQALNAIVFLYREVLGMEQGVMGQIERPVRRPKLPTGLTKDEVRRVLAVVAPEYQLKCTERAGAVEECEGGWVRSCR